MMGADMMRKLLFVVLVTLMLCFVGCGDGSVSAEFSKDEIPLLTVDSEENQETMPADDPEESQETSPATKPNVGQVTLPAYKPEDSLVTVPSSDPNENPVIIPASKPTVDFQEEEHSAYYLPGLDVETLITYFSEVVLDAEFINSGNASVVQKWDQKVLYYIHGDVTQQDYTYLDSTVDWLNSIYGFPGMEEAQNEAEANLQIHFTDYNGMIDVLGKQYEFSDGGVTFWFNSNRIYKEIICIRSDIDQYIRNSVIQEEIYNGMGPVQDTSLRTDSMIYVGYTTPQDFTAVDRLIMTLLYHPDIDYGMDAEECAAVIRQLYY